MPNTEPRDVVGMSNGYAYIINRRNLDTHDVQFFKGFYNEVERVGTEDECQCWENEAWCDNEDEAFKFANFEEAKAVFENLVKTDDHLRYLTMYGKTSFKNYGGSCWYPLKTFKV